MGTDTLGLLLTAVVTTASMSDTTVGVRLLSRITTAHPRIRKARVDGGYRTTAIDHGARLGLDVHPVQRPPGTRAPGHPRIQGDSKKGANRNTPETGNRPLNTGDASAQ
ncbi:transposase [Streptomyces griseocarneus]|uniref:transposase n=1 Tax=Streptomyces griseocarneus TaxID=51201 RepID=UPI001E521C36